MPDVILPQSLSKMQGRARYFNNSKSNVEMFSQRRKARKEFLDYCSLRFPGTARTPRAASSNFKS